jgi:hypothetical protein
MINKTTLLSLVFGVALASPNLVYAECANDIIGKWQQSYVEFEGNRINDDSQSWEFMANGTVRFLKPTVSIDVSADYSCEGDIIFMMGSVPGRLKILAFDGETMSWESLDHGPGITHVVRVE